MSINLANQIACQAFVSALKRNKAAQEYLYTRGLSKEIIAKYQIGYSCNIIDILKGHGLPYQHLATLDGNYEYFTNRIMLPFLEKDKVISFTSRAFPESDKKHLHQRGDISFYNIDDLEKDYVIIVESPICCLTLKQYNINSVALCGSSRNHIDKIDPKTKIWLVPDIEASKVSEREFIKFAAKLRQKTGAPFIKIAYLTDLYNTKTDVNSYMLNHSVADFRRIIQQAVNIDQHKPVAGIDFKTLLEKKKQIPKEVVFNNKITQIKTNLNILDIIREYCNVVEYGSLHACVCPFHQDSNPSLMIYEDTQSWYCFGCNTGGDIIEFIKQIEKVEFQHAVGLLYGRINSGN